MDVIRRIVVLGSLLAVAFGVWGLVTPVSTSPRIAIGDLSISLPKAEASTVACGSVVAPKGPSEGDGLGALIADTGRALVAQGCPRALSKQARVSTQWIAGGLVAMVLALLVLRTPQRQTRGAAGAYAPGLPDPAPGCADPAELPRQRRAGGRRAALAGLGILAVGAAVVYATRHVETSAELSAGTGSLSVSAQNEAERACVTSTRIADGSLRETAGIRATADEKGAVLNLDGDAAYVEYARALAELDVTACPADFRSAFADWSAAWMSYGDFLHEASQFHAPWDSDWSRDAVSAGLAERLADVERCDHELASASGKVGGDWPTRSWSTG